MGETSRVLWLCPSLHLLLLILFMTRRSFISQLQLSQSPLKLHTLTQGRLDPAVFARLGSGLKNRDQLKDCGKGHFSI